MQITINEYVCNNELCSIQEKELAAAAEKLAECQETIFLLGKQLKNLRPQSEFMASPLSERSQKGKGLNEDEPTTSGMNLPESEQAELETATSAKLNQVGAESPIDVLSAPLSPSDTESNILRSPINSKNLRLKSPKSGSSSSSSSAPTPEKHSRGFSRFFSSKGKNGH